MSTWTISSVRQVPGGSRELTADDPNSVYACEVVDERENGKVLKVEYRIISGLKIHFGVDDSQGLVGETFESEQDTVSTAFAQFVCSKGLSASV